MTTADIADSGGELSNFLGSFSAEVELGGGASDRDSIKPGGRTLGQWNYFVASGGTKDERDQRLAMVPEPLRHHVESHVRTVFKLKSFHRGRNRARP